MSNIGRPRLGVTAAQLQAGLDAAARGVGVAAVCEAMGVGWEVFQRLLDDDVLFARDYNRARMYGFESAADRLATIALDPDVDVLRARLQSDNTKWLLSKRHASVYGDRIEVHASGGIDLRAAMAAGERRLARVNAATPVLPTQQELIADAVAELVGDDSVTGQQSVTGEVADDDVDPFS